MAPGDEPGLGAEPLEQVDGLVDRAGARVLEGRGYLHVPSSPRVRCDGSPNSGHLARRDKRSLIVALDVTFAQLRSFAAVARTGSVTGAARALGVSEPAVAAALAA